METPLQITFRNLENTPGIEKRLRAKVQKLERHIERIISCQIVIELTKDHPHQGKLYNVRINLNLPNKELVVNRNQQADLYVGIRDAFHDILRQAADARNILDGDIKTHPQLLEGKIVRIFNKGDNFGFIETANGDEFYFNESNVVYPSFKKLHVGEAVQFIEMMGDEGPQAHRIRARERE